MTDVVKKSIKTQISCKNKFSKTDEYNELVTNWIEYLSSKSIEFQL